MRAVIGLIVGIVVAIAVIVVIEGVGHAAQPMPPGLDVGDPRAMAALVERTPTWLKLLVVAGYFIGVLAGAWKSLRIGSSGWTAWTIGAVFAAAGIASVVQIPHPMWMQAGSVLAPLLGAWAALHLPRGRRAPA